MFAKIKTKIIENKKTLLYIAIFFGLYMLFSDFAFADGTKDAAVSNQNKFEQTLATLNKILVGASTALAMILGIFAQLVTLFLTPGWYSGAIFDMTTKFKELWILVSNVVYFIFALLLIIIAFANILGIGENKFGFKQALPKFIIGILIVPFSWFIVQFVISLSSILTVAVLNLPFKSFPDFQENVSQTEIPNICEINLSSLEKDGKKGSNNNGLINCKSDNGTGTEGKTNIMTLGELLNSSDSSDTIGGIVALYVYGVIGIEGIDKASNTNVINGIVDISAKLLFDSVFVIAYSLLMIALGLALMIRGIRVWIYMILSPLFGLMYFFGKTNDGFFKHFSIKEFISLAFVPVYAMAALSFGLLFLYVTSTGIIGVDPKKSLSQSLEEDQKGLVAEQEGEGTDKRNSLTIGKFSLTIKGNIADEKTISKVQEYLTGAKGKTLGMVGYLILKIFGIVVLWGTLMTALRSSEITKQIVEPIFQLGENIGNTAVSLPQHAPVLPGGVSLSGLNRVPELWKQEIQNKSMESGNKFASQYFNLGNGELTKAITSLTNLANDKRKMDSNEGKKEFINEVKSIFAQHGDNALKNTELQNLMKTHIDKNLKFSNLSELAYDMYKFENKNKNIYGDPGGYKNPEKYFKSSYKNTSNETNQANTIKKVDDTNTDTTAQVNTTVNAKTKDQQILQQNKIKIPENNNNQNN